MTAEAPKFFIKIDPKGRVENLGDRFNQVFTPDLPQPRISNLK